MKKYLIIILLFFCFFMSTLFSKYSYAYNGCDSFVLEPKMVNSFNFVDYMESITYNEVYSICSYDFCYNVLEGNSKESIDNFSKLYLNDISDDDLLIVNVKGIPITKIVVNNCQ